MALFFFFVLRTEKEIMAFYWQIALFLRRSGLETKTATENGPPSIPIYPAFIITHLAAWLNQPKQAIIAGVTEWPLLPACPPVKVPLVGLIKPDLIWNEWCGLPCLSRPRALIFITHSLSHSLRHFICSCFPLWVESLLRGPRRWWETCEDPSNPQNIFVSCGNIWQRC